jgi:hypothetical protein
VLFDPIGQQPPLVRFDGEGAFGRRHGALVAVAPLADPAGDADRLVGGVVADVEVVGIDEGAGMGDFAAEADRIALDRRAEAAAGLRYGAGEREVADTVRGFGELAQEAAGDLEGLVDVPERAAAAEAGELQPGR